MGLGMMLPSFLHFPTVISISWSYNTPREIFLPIVKRRRSILKAQAADGTVDFMSFILNVVDDDEQAVDLVTSQSGLASVIYRSPSSLPY